MGTHWNRLTEVVLMGIKIYILNENIMYFRLKNVIVRETWNIVFYRIGVST